MMETFSMLVADFAKVVLEEVKMWIKQMDLCT